MGKRFLSLLILLLLPWQAEAGLRKLQQNLDTTVNIHLVNASTGAGITGATVTSITAFVAKHKDTGTTTKTDITVTAAGGSTTDAREVGLGAYNLEIPASLVDTLGDLTLCYSYTAAVTTCDTYEVSAASDPQFAGDFGSITDFWTEPLPGAFAAGSAGYILGTNLDVLVSSRLAPTVAGRTLDVSPTGEAGVDWSNVGSPTTSVTLSGTTVGVVSAVTGLTASNLDATISSRMATYTQPTGFLAATFPTTVASTTNITAGTITTATNLTNLPTIPTNWITAAGIASDASTEFATTFLGSFIEGTTTLKQSAQYWNSALVGKYNSSAGTFNFRDIGDTKNRVVYTTTATSRATVTLSPD